MTSQLLHAARGLALGALLLLALAGPAGAAEPAPVPPAVETDDQALQDIRRAVEARDAEALLKRVGGLGVEGGADRLVSPGWIKKYLSSPGSEVARWVFGPKGPPPKGAPAPWTMAACLASTVELGRTGADTAEVRCRRGGQRATFGLTRHQGRWAITRDFFWPNELVTP